MSRSFATAAILLVLAGLVVASIFSRDRDPAPAAADGQGPASATADDDGATPATGAIGRLQPTTAPQESDRSHLFALPDGTFVPNLNGATFAAPLADYWGNRPFSPIVGVRNSDGVDWYEHADGSFSTTVMVWREDLGRHAAMTRVGRPGPQPPPIRR